MTQDTQKRGKQRLLYRISYPGSDGEFGDKYEIEAGTRAAHRRAGNKTSKETDGWIRIERIGEVRVGPYSGSIVAVDKSDFFSAVSERLSVEWSDESMKQDYEEWRAAQ